MTANSLVSAKCNALNCDSSSSRSSAEGQEAGFKTDTIDPGQRREIDIQFQKELQLKDLQVISIDYKKNN